MAVRISGDIVQVTRPKRVLVQASTATLTIDCDSYDGARLTAQAAALAIAAPTGTPTDQQMLEIEIKDNGTARAIDWTTAGVFQVIGIVLPTTTFANKIVKVLLQWNATAAKWDAVSVSQQA